MAKKAEKNLVIVESPAKAKTIAKYLGKGYKVEASNGHVRDLPKSKIGVDIEGGFVPDYQPIKGKEDVIQDLKKAAKAVGEKSIAMIAQKELLPLTGYIHGGCSPLGMKKQFPTVFHETAEIVDTIIVSAGKIGYQVELAPAALLEITDAAMADIVV